MKKNTRTRFASNLMLFPAGQYLAKMLAEVFAKAKAAEATEKRPDWGTGSGPGYASAGSQQARLRVQPSWGSLEALVQG
jgi:hypothetical protein